MTGRSGLAAAVLVVVGGLAITGSATTAWVTLEHAIEIGDVPISETDERPGTAYAPLSVAWGVIAAVLGIALAAVGGLLRRVLGGVVVLVGVVALGELAYGTVAAVTSDGVVGGGPGVGVVGGLAVLAGGAMATRRQAPPQLGERFDIDERADAVTADDEWALSSDAGTEDVSPDDLEWEPVEDHADDAPQPDDGRGQELA